MMKREGAWKLYSVAEIESWEGVTECPRRGPLVLFLIGADCRAVLNGLSRHSRWRK